ncbi:TetR/AcrR family transcriptional regulator [Oecophyllibacter saccharovorans]|uniref:TetR/AcrR family transcriptional regulator n=1 Tax=Oecophyllibacter saccharovorans TaxID=2558360 RepID=UPI0011431F48|nr:TetR/AcrR family transcriptional regulator [Oecophyllibacter saccharovorans]QDH15232.1 TetR/AcrR family transcriptional regulator [Oecophyllibacter saccharovorans]
MDSESPARQADEQLRRSRILETACTLLRTHGYHATSMDRIARQAGMSKKTLYQLFTSKQNLFEQLLLERLFPSIGEDPAHGPDIDMEQTLIAHFRKLSPIIFDEERLALLRTIIGETNRSPAIQQAMTEALQLSGHKTGLRAWIRHQQEAGCLRPGEPTDVADHLIGLTLGVPLLSRLTHCLPPRSPEALEAFMRTGIRAFLQAWSREREDRHS